MLEILKKFVSPQKKDVVKLYDKISESLKPTNTYVEERIQVPTEQHILKHIAHNSDDLTTIHLALRREVFRKGLELDYKDNTDEEVLTSENNELRSESEIKKIRNDLLKRFEDVNENGQTLLEVLGEFEDDLNIYDDAYLLFVQKYFYDEKGMIISDKTEVQEILRVDAANMELIINDQDRPARNNSNDVILFCPECRNQEYTKKEVCRCGLRLVPAHYRTRQSPSVYYAKEEVIHKNRYRPSKKYGYSPIKTLYQKISILREQDEYNRTLYTGKRPPKSLLVFTTSNMNSLKSSFEEMMERTRQNPHMPGVMGLEADFGGKGSGKPAEFYDFMRGLDELQFTDFRRELRNSIGVLYGVQPMFTGDQSQSGGLNNEGLQITVTNRVIETNQRFYNEHVLRKIMSKMRCSDFVLKLRPSEELDEMSKLQRQHQSLTNAALASSLGLVAEWNDRNGEAVISAGYVSSAGSVSDQGNSYYSSDVSSLSVDNNNRDLPKKFVGDVVKSLDELKEIIAKKVAEFEKTYKKKPNKAELKKISDEVAFYLQNVAKKRVDDYLEKEYKDTLSSLGDSLKTVFSFGLRDEEALRAVLSDKVLQTSFLNLSNDVARKIHDLISDAYKAYESFSLKDVEDELRNVVSLSESRAELIARTETAKVQNAARRSIYKQLDPENKGLYRHIGPSDDRTTDTSKRIKQRTRNGVSWDDYVRIMKEESSKEYPDWVVNEDYPLSHYQSRHTFIKIK